MSNDVRRPKQYETMLSDLCHTDNKIFLSYKDLLVFAACLGFAKNKRRPFEKTSETVGLHTFKGAFDDCIFQSIALCEKKDPTIMSDDNIDQRIKLFEEYAAGGLEIINTRIYKGPEDWDVALLGLITEQEFSENTILDDITNVVN